MKPADSVLQRKKIARLAQGFKPDGIWFSPSIAVLLIHRSAEEASRISPLPWSTAEGRENSREHFRSCSSYSNQGLAVNKLVYSYDCLHVILYQV